MTVSGLAVSRISVQQGIGDVTDGSEMTSDRSLAAGVGVSRVTEEPRKLQTGFVHSFLCQSSSAGSRSGSRWM